MGCARREGVDFGDSLALHFRVLQSGFTTKDRQLLGDESAKHESRSQGGLKLHA